MFNLNILCCVIFLIVPLNILSTSDDRLSKYADMPCIFKNGQPTGIYQKITLDCATLPTRFFPNQTTEKLDGKVEKYFCCPENRISEQVCNENYPTIWEARISAGQTVTSSEIPYLAALFEQKIAPEGDNPYDKFFLCGGSIISEWYIITAAHCFRTDDSNYYVVLGKTNITSIPVEDYREVDIIYKHQNYNKDKHNDIALIKTKKQIIFEKSVIFLICLQYKMNNDGKIKISGWGKWNQTLGMNYLRYFIKFIVYGKWNQTLGERSEILRQAEVTYLNGTYCENRDNFKKEIQFCAIDPDSSAKAFNRSDACMGDSGGSATKHENETPYLMGIISYGTGCGSPLPGIYTRVSSFIDWIESIVWLDSRKNTSLLNGQWSKYANKPCTFNNGNFIGIYKPKTFNCTTLPSGIHPNETTEKIHGKEKKYFCCPELRVSEQVCNANSRSEKNNSFTATVYEYSQKNLPQLICSGSVISEFYILTAANCFQHLNGTKFSVLVENTSSIDFIKAIVIQHDNFVNAENHNDIALIKTEKRIVFPVPICLYLAELPGDQKLFFYGVSKCRFDWYKGLARVDVSSVFNNTEINCKEQQSLPPVENRFCLSKQIKQLSPSTCNLTGGGAVYTFLNTRYVLIGFRSYDNQNETIFTRVLSYLDWIENTVWLS